MFGIEILSLESLQYLINDYGYWLVFFFSIIEGELVLFLAGVLASKGLLSINKVIIVAFCGTVFSEQITYQIGKKFAHRAKAILIALITEKRTEKLLNLISKRSIEFIICSRFIYGIRLISPIIVGVANVSFYTFTILNIISAIIWACSVSLLGYYLHDTIEQHIGSFSDNKMLHIALITAAILVLLIVTKIISFIISKMIGNVDKE